MKRIGFLKNTLALGAALALGIWASGAPAQNLFAPVAYVNDGAVTGYELNQRILLMKLLSNPGNVEKLALERLIDERLQKEAGQRAGIQLTSEDITNGIEEFAQRTDQSGEQFLATLAREGIAPESFRDFVVSGLIWRQLVRDRFAAQVSVSDAEIDEAIAQSGTRGSARVLISEIFLPINTPANEAITLELAPQIAKLRSIDEFAQAARQYSAGPSRDRGGRVEKWLPIENLPPQIKNLVLTMTPGQVTDPIEIPNALALFQLRALRETTAPAPKNPALDYAAYYIAGGHSPEAMERAAKLRAQVDTCDDLYGIAQNEPPDVLERDTLPLADIPTDIALELAKLDTGEVSTALTRANGQTLVFLMLCERKRDQAAEFSREAVSSQLRNRRLSKLADGYLDTLRANADIRLP